MEKILAIFLKSKLIQKIFKGFIVGFSIDTDGSKFFSYVVECIHFGQDPCDFRLTFDGTFSAFFDFRTTGNRPGLYAGAENSVEQGRVDSGGDNRYLPECPLPRL